MFRRRGTGNEKPAPAGAAGAGSGVGLCCAEIESSAGPCPLLVQRQLTQMVLKVHFPYWNLHGLTYMPLPWN